MATTAGKPECQTILVLIAARDDGGDGGNNGNSETCANNFHLASVRSPLPTYNTPFIEVGCLASHQHQRTAGMNNGATDVIMSTHVNTFFTTQSAIMQ